MPRQRKTANDNRLSSMTIDQFTAKWFTAYYFALGLLLFCSGIVMLFRAEVCQKYLSSEIKMDEPPAFLRSVLKYFFIFTIPGFIFSFIPFIWYDLLFSLWSFVMIFVIGSQLVHWPQTRLLLKNNFLKIPVFTKWAGAGLIIISLITAFLGYQEIQRLFAG